ncbi:MAG TPA: hypothetical protein PLL39_06805, partial [Rhodocyclaceae bacterium]|nr:hypothetical protein [Rhodocyclaceae bacterium]
MKKLLSALVAGLFAATTAIAAEPRVLLNLPDSGSDPTAIRYDELPRLRGEHAVVNHAALGPHARTPDQVDVLDLRLNLH